MPVPTGQDENRQGHQPLLPEPREWACRRYAVIPGNRATIRVYEYECEYEYGRPAGGSVIRTRTRTRTRKSAMVFWGTPPTWGQTHRQFWYLS